MVPTRQGELRVDEAKEVVLESGEGVLFYSDGLVEAHDPEGEMFSFPRLRALVAEHGEETSLEDFLLEELYSFVGEGWEQEDDITLLALRRSAARSRDSENPYHRQSSQNSPSRYFGEKGPASLPACP